MAESKESKIFIDADAFVAIINFQDSNHKKAIKLICHIKKKNLKVLTSSFAVGEAITVISQKIGQKKAIAFGRKIYQGEIGILGPERVQQIKALEKFARQKSKNARFTDFVNMVLMDELEIKRIFSFDKHYPKSGYKLFSGVEA